jgi:MarR family transcriptional regulator, lower aerobic nicotinate degradation pathway regulator
MMRAVQASQPTAPADEDLPLPEALLRIPGWLMLQILRSGKRDVKTGPEGPRLPHMAVLASLVEFGPQSQADVARRLGFDPSDVVAVVDTIEAAGHAVRARDPHDRRRYALAVTPAGRRWLRSKLALVDERSAALLRGLDADEQAQLVRLLQRVLAHHDARVPGHYRSA